MNLLAWIARFALELGAAADETLALDLRAAAIVRVSERIAELRSWLAGELAGSRASGYPVGELRVLGGSSRISRRSGSSSHASSRTISGDAVSGPPTDGACREQRAQSS